MSNFVMADIGLTDQQKRQVQKAVAANSGVKLRFTNKQLTSGSGQLPLTNSQYNKALKSAQKGKGCDITLSKTQLNKMKTGGFLPLILPALIGAVAPFLLNKLFPQKQEGDGINIPGAHGINIPGARGRGMIKGDNGGPISNNTTGNQSSFFENQTDPYEETLPANRNRVRRPMKTLRTPQPRNQKNLKSASGFVHPNSEAAFQMLQ